MNKIIPLSLIALATLNATEVELEPISVESTVITEVAQNAQVSADLSQSLSQSVPSVEMNRRSGIANDIYIRGQKRDNISVEVDGTKVCGACVNRMDPPVSHVLASQIDSIEVTEGPYDVENFGTLSGGVKISTKKPTKDAHGEVTFGYGSWNYMKVGATASGGSDDIRFLLSASSESSDQYKDGDSNTLSQQIDNYVATHPFSATKDPRIQDKYKDMRAYTKKSVMGKAFISLSDNQELKLSATLNRSDDVLYPTSKMDALYDYSNIYSVIYNLDNLNEIFKNLNLEYYFSDVDHPMGTDYRVSSENSSVMVNHLKTSMQGLKLKNKFDILDSSLVVGLDASRRNWDGNYYKDGEAHSVEKSIDNSYTDNIAIFSKISKNFSKFDVSLGVRIDATHITNETYNSNTYNGLGLNLMGNYAINNDDNIFLGIGRASRVPDARELYFVSSTGSEVGSEHLSQITNNEIDLGYKLDSDSFSAKVKLFYSYLEDYIYYNKSLTSHNFENIDASIYGVEFSSTYYINDDITLDSQLAYKVGKKETLTTNQTGTNLADIAPLRGNVALNYEYKNNSLASLTLRASDKWDKIDSENGEQVLSAWAVADFKIKHTVNKNFNFTFGVNNIFDKTYAISNTYADLTLLTDGGDVMLMNEPGRYIYINLNFKF